MKLLTMLKGLPASGKTTFARKRVLENDGWVRVNKDDIRSMLGCKWSKNIELLVLGIRDSIIKESLIHGYSIVVDDTNYHPKHEARIRQLAKEAGVKVEIVELATDVDTCIERDSKRPNPVGEEVIRKMWSENQ